MSEDAVAEQPTSEPSALATTDRDERLLACMATELQLYRHDNEGSTSPLATTTTAELYEAPRTRVLRLRQMLLLEMLVAGIPAGEICARLSIHRSMMPRLLQLVLRDDLSADAELLRTLTAERINWLRQKTHEMIEAKPTPNNIAVGLALEKVTARLFGLNKQQAQLHDEPRQISIVLKLIESREQLLTSPLPALTLDESTTLTVASEPSPEEPSNG